MKKYRNKMRGPLPVALRSGSISVPSKGYFNVDGDDDLNSPDLLTKVRTGKIKLVEEVVSITVPDGEKKEDKSPEKTVNSIGSEDATGDVEGNKKEVDSLTSSPEMVESTETEKNENEEETSVNDGELEESSDPRVGRVRRKNRKGITG